MSKDLRFVKVFYGTNRKREDVCARIDAASLDQGTGCKPDGFYGITPAPRRGDRPEESGLEVGMLTVTFPPEHTTGEIERPPKIFTFTLRGQDPNRDVVVSELRSFSGDHAAWVREVKSAGRDQAFIYVHGFETTFADAARRAAQVAYDLDFDVSPDFQGLTMMYSWPSRGGTLNYIADSDASLHAAATFLQFFDLVKGEAGIRRVHVIAHSMGNRLVAEALSTLPRDQRKVDQLILAAPDIWATHFRDRFLKVLPRIAERVTLYVSDGDKALIASRKAHSGEPRAGEIQGGLLNETTDAGFFDPINASDLATDFLGHSYYASNASMLSDIYCLLKGTPPERRPLLARVQSWWQFKTAEERARLSAGACLPAVTPAPPGPRHWWVLVPVLLGILTLILLAAARRRRQAEA